jgi:chaperonin GroES
VPTLPLGAGRVSPIARTRRHTHDIPSAARPRRRPPHRSRGKDQGRHHHPGHAKEKPQEGEIVAVGPGARDESGKLVALDVKAGDRVLFGKWSGTEVRIDGQDLLIMKESDIMGVIEQSAEAKKAA